MKTNWLGAAQALSPKGSGYIGGPSPFNVGAGLIGGVAGDAIKAFEQRQGKKKNKQPDLRKVLKGALKPTDMLTSILGINPLFEVAKNFVVAPDAKGRLKRLSDHKK